MQPLAPNRADLAFLQAQTVANLLQLDRLHCFWGCRSFLGRVEKVRRLQAEMSPLPLKQHSNFLELRSSLLWPRVAYLQAQNQNTAPASDFAATTTLKAKHY